jgi:hypothetical protein
LLQPAYTKLELEDIISDTFDDIGISKQMILIANCESSFNPNIEVLDTNSKMSKGLFMLNGTNAPKEWRNPVVNAEYARKVYDKQGFKAWYSCSRKFNIE